jgi:hypothetical protein
MCNFYANKFSRHGNNQKTFQSSKIFKYLFFFNLKKIKYYLFKTSHKRVYASPSKRDLASKGTEEMMTYPNLYFIIDDFDEVIHFVYT